MDYEKYLKMLSRYKRQAKIEMPLSDIGKAFNDGIDTMASYAQCMLRQIEIDEQEGKNNDAD